MSRRIRKHANPFNVLTDLGVLDRRAIFGREAPLEVDLGCGGAAFLFERAKNHPELDFVGIEIRKPLVEAAAARKAREGIPNVAVFYANSLENMRIAEPGVIATFHVQFPDPCFKKRHQKRRIVQPKSVRAMAEVLAIGGRVHLQSDVKPLAEEMFRFMAEDVAFEAKTDPSLRIAKLFLERTEWERQHEREDEPVYRMLFEKVREPSGAIREAEFSDTNPLRINSEPASEP
jgi:tRNA (guanine-N7-)-methyltransferase